MPKVYGVGTFVSGEGLQVIDVPRAEGATDDEYKSAAFIAREARRTEVIEKGLNGRVLVTLLNAPSSEETATQLAAAHAFEEAGGRLPSTDDIICRAV